MDETAKYDIPSKFSAYSEVFTGENAIVSFYVTVCPAADMS